MPSGILEFCSNTGRKVLLWVCQGLQTTIPCPEGQSPFRHLQKAPPAPALLPMHTSSIPGATLGTHELKISRNGTAASRELHTGTPSSCQHWRALQNKHGWSSSERPRGSWAGPLLSAPGICPGCHWQGQGTARALNPLNQSLNQTALLRSSLCSFQHSREIFSVSSPF